LAVLARTPHEGALAHQFLKRYDPDDVWLADTGRAIPLLNVTLRLCRQAFQPEYTLVLSIFGRCAVASGLMGQDGSEFLDEM
jgi:hypothetical protein